MATRRIKEITNTATTFASDDFIALDGTTQGTRKMDKDDLIAEVSAGVSGDYLEEANNLSDVASVDTSKLNLEVPDVGTAPNEVPLNGQLGSMAYQSAEAVSVAKAEIETLEVTDKITGNLGIGGSNTYPLTVSKTGDNVKVDITNTVNANFRIGTSGSAAQIGPSTSSSLELQTGGTTRCTIDSSGKVGIGNTSPSETLSVSSSNTGRTGVSVGNTTTGGRTYIIGSVGSATDGGAAAGSFTIRDGNASANRVTIDSSGNTTLNSGNLVIGTSGKGIDFSATSDGSGSGQAEILDDFESGQWSPQLYSSGGSLTATMDVRSARYVKVGHKVTVMCYIRTSNVDNSSASGTLRISGLPFGVAGSNNYTAVSVGHALNWATAPAGGYTESGASNIILDKRASIGGDLSPMAPSDLTNGSGTNNEVMLTATYCSF